MPAKQLMTLS